MPDEAKKYDVLMIPRSLDGGGNMINIGARLKKIARPLMGLGEKDTFAFGQVGQKWFCRRSIDDTLLFPSGHRMEKQDRYDWDDIGEAGIRGGTYRPEPADDV